MMKIVSPVASACGAYVLHKSLEDAIDGYQVHDYAPSLEYFPFIFPFFLSGFNPDIIHTTPDYGVFFHRKHVPLVITVHHLVLDSFMRQYSSFLQRVHYQTDLLWFTKMSLNQADMVTCVSKSTAAMVKELGFEKDIRVIYNGIDSIRFKPGKLKLGAKRERIRVLFSGNLTLRKGAHWLPLIADRLNPGIEICFTRGLRNAVPLPYRPNLVDLGYVMHDDIPSLYQSSDILLSPSVREGFGLAVAEAMASGLPVVATNCSSLPELVIDGEGGCLCSVGNVRGFAEKINWLAENATLRKSMGEYNRARIEKLFTHERMIKEYQLLFEEVLDTYEK